jgi:hypothetical protein
VCKVGADTNCLFYFTYVDATKTAEVFVYRAAQDLKKVPLVKASAPGAVGQPMLGGGMSHKGMVGPNGQPILMGQGGMGQGGMAMAMGQGGMGPPGMAGMGVVQGGGAMGGRMMGHAGMAQGQGAMQPQMVQRFAGNPIPGVAPPLGGQMQGGPIAGAAMQRPAGVPTRPIWSGQIHTRGKVVGPITFYPTNDSEDDRARVGELPEVLQVTEFMAQSELKRLGMGMVGYTQKMESLNPADFADGASHPVGEVDVFGWPLQLAFCNTGGRFNVCFFCRGSTQVKAYTLHMFLFPSSLTWRATCLTGGQASGGVIVEAAKRSSVLKRCV